MKKKERRRQAQERDPNIMTGPAADQAGSSTWNPAAFAEMAQALAALGKSTSSPVPRTPENNPFRIAVHPERAMPPKKRQMAFDSALVANNDFAAAAWLQGIGGEGLLFLGYPYLAELAQRPEYRIISETIADDATRKWIDFDVADSEKELLDRRAKDPRGEAERQADPDERRRRVKAAGKTDKIKALKDDQLRLDVRDRFYALARDDGFFGRSHLYMNFGEDVDSGAPELRKPIGDGLNEMSKAKVGKGKFKELKVIEAVWTYPQAYNANNPLASGWYSPQQWYVMGTEVHGSRLLTFVGHSVPDLLKPAYSFGGLSLSQMAKPYVDIWLITRESVGRLVHSFSVMVMKTDLSTAMEPGAGIALGTRVRMFNTLRDNQGLFVLNKNTEDFSNVSASLSGLHELQAQAQEHMASVARIPVVKFTGIDPAGLNASSEGSLKAYYDTIAAYQNRFFRPNLARVVNFEQMSLYGEVDPGITIKFESLWELTDAEMATKQKSDADRHQVYVDMGAIDNSEVRRIIVADPELPYAGLDPDEMPESLLEEEEAGLQIPGGRPEVQEAEVQEQGAEPESRSEPI